MKEMKSNRIEQPYKYWKHFNIGRQTGIIIGYRTLSNGYILREYDEGITFIPDTYIKVQLVSYHPRCNPVYVLPEHLTFLEKSPLDFNLSGVDTPTE